MITKDNKVEFFYSFFFKCGFGKVALAILWFIKKKNWQDFELTSVFANRDFTGDWLAPIRPDKKLRPAISSTGLAQNKGAVSC